MLGCCSCIIECLLAFMAPALVFSNNPLVESLKCFQTLSNVWREKTASCLQLTCRVLLRNRWLSVTSRENFYLLHIKFVKHHKYVYFSKKGIQFCTQGSIPVVLNRLCGAKIQTGAFCMQSMCLVYLATSDPLETLMRKNVYHAQ